MSNVVVRQFGSVGVAGRPGDGYINATALCQAAEKRWPDYWRTDRAREFVEALSSVVQIPTTALVESRRGGTPSEQGTWVHPDMAIDVAQWASPLFAVQVSRWVRELMTVGRVELAPAAPPLSPWGRRIDELALPFVAAVNARHDHRFWPVIKLAMMVMLPVEDALNHVGMPTAEGDLMDGSIGGLFARHRAGKPWAGEVRNDVQLLTAHGHYCRPALYGHDEAPWFDHWLCSEYLPRHLPNYAVNKLNRLALSFRGRPSAPRLPSGAEVVKTLDPIVFRATGRRLEGGPRLLSMRDQGSLFD